MIVKKRIFRILPKSDFIKNTFILASGSAIAQSISFVFLIILQRWFYTPKDFGILGLYVSLSTLFVACSTLKFEYGIVMPKDDKKAISLAQLSFLSVILIMIASIPLLFLFKESLTEAGDAHFHVFLVLMPFTILFSGIYEILTYWNNRKGTFAEMSKSRVVQSSSMEISRVVTGMLGVDYRGLILGRVIGQFTSLCYLVHRFIKEQRLEFLKFETERLKATFREYRDFPLFTMPTIFISNFSNLLLIALFFQFYGDSEAGLVSIAIQYIALPFGIIATSFAQVFFQRISTHKSAKELLSLYIKFALRLGAASLLVIAVVYMIPDSMILILIGEKWKGLTEFMKLSVLWQAIAFISSSLSFIYTRLMKQNVMMFFALLQLTLVYATLNYGNSHYSDPYKSFSLYVYGQCFYYLLAIVAAIYLIKKSEPFLSKEANN